MRPERRLDDLRRAGSPSTFRDFMDAALFDPAEGYYGSGRVKFGARGDFSTASTLHPVFAEVVAACALDVWEALERPSDFTFVEVGPGDGSLARAVLEQFSDVAPAEFSVRYLLVERSDALADRQRSSLRDAPVQVEWTSLEWLAAAPVTGVIFSNELVDALPVHRARVRDRRVEEQFVAFDGTRWVSQWAAPSTPELARYIARYAPGFLDLDSSPELEIGLDAVAWLREAAAALDSGVVITFDYGDVATRLFIPVRQEGTIRGFRDHQLVLDPLADAGRVDLTAHVNFSALQDAGREAGLATLAFEPQRAFCSRYSIADRIAGRASRAALSERLAMKALLAPGGLPDAMRVLVQGKNLPPTNDFPRSPI